MKHRHLPKVNPQTVAITTTNVIQMVYLKYMKLITSDAGVFALQWAPNTIGAVDTTVMAGSVLDIVKLV